jgi:hypothetical protein
MEVKTEITRLWKDLSASAREFASLGLATGGKALEAARGHLGRLEENLKRQAEKLKTDGNGETAESPKQ